MSETILVLQSNADSEQSQNVINLHGFCGSVKNSYDGKDQNRVAISIYDEKYVLGSKTVTIDKLGAISIIEALCKRFDIPMMNGGVYVPLNVFDRDKLKAIGIDVEKILEAIKEPTPNIQYMQRVGRVDRGSMSGGPHNLQQIEKGAGDDYPIISHDPSKEMFMATAHVERNELSVSITPIPKSDLPPAIGTTLDDGTIATRPESDKVPDGQDGTYGPKEIYHLLYKQSDLNNFKGDHEALLCTRAMMIEGGTITIRSCSFTKDDLIKYMGLKYGPDTSWFKSVRNKSTYIVFSDSNGNYYGFITRPNETKGTVH